MSNVIREYLGLPKISGLVGQELEVEGKSILPSSAGLNWMIHREGSIRGHAIEYVSAAPRTVPNALSDLKELIELLSRKEYDTIKDSPRTSYHVHFNILERTPTQYWNIIVAYWLLENLLFKFCSPHRKGNHFCLRLADAEDLIRSCVVSLRARLSPIVMISQDEVKYSGQNLASASLRGSLEYRGMDGHIDYNRYRQWLVNLSLIHEKASAFPSPAALLDWYFDARPINILFEFFNGEFSEILMKNKDWPDLLRENIGILSEIAYFHDWEAWERSLPKTTGYDNPRAVRAPPAPRRSSAQVLRDLADRAAQANTVLNTVYWSTNPSGDLFETPRSTRENV